MTATPPCLRTLGGLALDGADPAFSRGAKRALVLTYMAVERPGGLTSRRFLLDLFWPALDIDRARHALRNTLHSIRKVLGPEAIVAGGPDAVGLAPDAVWCDAVAFTELAGQPDDVHTQAVLDLYRGPFLEGVVPRSVSPALEHWVDGHRARLRRAYLALLEAHASAARVAGNLELATRHLRTRVDMDPLDESSVVSLAEALMEAGQPADARELARGFVRMVRGSLGRGPGPELEAVLARLTPAPQPSRPEPGVGGGAENGHAFVGRQGSLAQLRAAWQRARSGHTELVLIQGEAGIGKTRLAEELLHEVQAAGGRVARVRSWAAEGRLAYGPVADLLRAPDVRPGLALLSTTWRTELARIVPELLESDAEVAQAPREGWERRRLFEAIVQALAAIGEPVVVLLDDLQWCDEETLAWLGSLPVLTPTVPLLLVGTVRIDEVPPQGSLHRIPLEYDRTGSWTAVDLAPLDDAEAAALASELAGSSLSHADLCRLLAHTRGSPLFIVETVRAGGLAALAGQADAHAPAMAPRVRAVLEHRLTHLSSLERQLADLAAAAGRAISSTLLAAAAGMPVEGTVAPLDALWRRRILQVTSQGAWDFTHDRLRDAAVGAIPPARRADLHQRLASALELAHQGDLAAASGRLAFHWEEAGDLNRALEARERAAGAALRLQAHPEVVRHLSEALRLLHAQPEGEERDRREAELQHRLGDALVSARGWASHQLRDAYRRATDLAIRLDLPHLEAGACWGLHSYHHVRAEFDGVRTMATQVRSLGRRIGAPGLAVLADYGFGLMHFHLGELEEAARVLGKTFGGLPDVEEEFGLWTGRNLLTTVAGVFQGHTACLRGRMGEAEAALALAARSAEASGSAFPRAIHACYAAMYWSFRDAPMESRTALAPALEICHRHDIPYYLAWATILEGWALSRTGDAEAGIERIREGHSAMQATGGRLRWPLYLGMIAEAQGSLGRHEEALATLEDADRVVEAHGERCWQPELGRVRARVLAQQGDLKAAADAAEEAMQVAAIQGAALAGLRLAHVLAEVIRDERGARPAAVRLGLALDEWTGDADAREVLEARALLAALG